ncbi:hypothetical protein [Ktedonospora formicarum]|uniref:BclA C-terminal domain-containing protein n=1 Tax=Ktedonospora formicarum TaxID=2778364 RepID=A0A8J3I6H2_9CHLR|nr:hypothetical protein [Ktedonospora formicarum]GHO46279.1 hypothetical protein KSX_44420 [Ktedonospora formicarum]
MPLASGGESGYVFTTGRQIVPAKGDIAFTTNGKLTSGIVHSTTASPERITVTNAGLYVILYSVSSIGPDVFSLFLNGKDEIDGSTYISNDYNQQNTGYVLVNLNANSYVTLRNRLHQSIYLQIPNDNIPDFVNASLFIQKVN